MNKHNNARTSENMRVARMNARTLEITHRITAAAGSKHKNKTMNTSPGVAPYIIKSIGRLTFVLWLTHLFKGSQTAQEILFCVKLYISIVRRRIEIISELHEITVNLTIVGTHNVPIFI